MWIHLSLLTAFHPRLHALDMLVVATYLGGITWFGLRFRKRERTLQSYFLADRNIPWWAIMLSIVSAETSTLTVISVPGLAFTGDFGFLTIAFGYLVGRAVVCVAFLPRYFRGELLTAYQLIDRRFGARLHRVTALFFLVMRAAAEGVRVFAVAIIVHAALGTGDVASIIIIALLTLVYTFEGGLSAVIWTDVVQMGIYAIGIVMALWLLVHRVPGGWPVIHHVAAAAGKFHLLDFTFNLTTTFTFWAGLIGGCFLTMASHGTDQLMVQRLLAARSLRDSQRALMGSAVLILIQFAVFLLIGAALFVFYSQVAPGAHFSSADHVFPRFIVTEFPTGFAGLVVAAILAAAMSNLSAALNALSSTTIMDFYRPHLNPGQSEKHYLWMSRLATVGWTVVLAAVAYASRDSRSVLVAGLAIISYPFSALLGVFLLGTVTRRANEFGAIVGMILGVAAAVALGLSGLPFTWFIVGGTVTTFLTGYAFSWLRPAPPSGQALPRAAAARQASS